MNLWDTVNYDILVEDQEALISGILGTLIRQTRCTPRLLSYLVEDRILHISEINEIVRFLIRILAV